MCPRVRVCVCGRSVSHSCPRHIASIHLPCKNDDNGHAYGVASCCAAAPGAPVTVSFDVTSGAGGPMAPHQVFARFTHVSVATSTAVFVAQSDVLGSYKITLNTANRDALKALTAGWMGARSYAVTTDVPQHHRYLSY